MAAAAGLHDRDPDFNKNGDLSQMSLQQAAAAAAAWQKNQGGAPTGLTKSGPVPWGSGSASSGWGGSNTGGSDRWNGGAQSGGPGGQWDSPTSGPPERDLSWNPSTAYFQQGSGERGGMRKGPGGPPAWNAGNW